MISKAHRFLSFSSNKSRGGKKKDFISFFLLVALYFFISWTQKMYLSLYKGRGLVIVSAETKSHYMLEKEIHHDQERNNTIGHRRNDVAH